MKIVDFRSCAPRQVAPMWAEYEKELRSREERLWQPKDIERRLQWAFQDAQSEPYAIGKVALDESEQAQGLLLTFRRELGKLDIMGTIYPSRFAIGVSFAHSLNADIANVVPALIKDTEAALIQRGIRDFYCLAPLAATEAIFALNELGFKSWIVLAYREAVQFEFSSRFEGKIRPAKPRDRETLVRLCVEMVKYHQEVDPRTSTEGDLEAIYRSEFDFALYDRDSVIFLAEINGLPVGSMHCALLRVEGEDRLPYHKPGYYGYVSSAAVIESARHHGVGKALFAAANEWFLSRRVSAVQLHYNTGNPISPRFWQSIGFKPLVMTMHKRIE